MPASDSSSHPPERPCSGSASAHKWGGALVALVLTVRASAHDSPEALVNRYSALMSAHGVTPLLLAKRAEEYAVLGELDKAATDWEHLLQLQPRSLNALTELSKVRLDAGRLTEAMTSVNQALALATRPEEQAQLYLIRAHIHRARGDVTNALADCERFFVHPVPDLDAFIIRSQLQLRLQQGEAAVAGLREGWERTGSAVLEAHWIEALIDAGRPAEALTQIELRLPETRWQSSWLLRRARARLRLGEVAAARDDLQRAIQEINPRLTSGYPDLTLLVDRGLAHALLGDTVAASRDLNQARRAGAEPWLLFRLEAAVTNAVLEASASPTR